MPFTGMADSQQLQILRKALDQHCLNCGIDETQEREHVALLIVSLCSTDVTSLEELLAGLEVATGRDERRQTTTASPDAP